MDNLQSTHITLILDRSGSMSDIQSDVIGGVNSFFNDQRATGLPITATLVQFDGMDPFEVLAENVSLDKIPALNSDIYRPRAATPLLDAIGQGIHSLSKHLDSLAKESKPGGIVFVIVTDGLENASMQFTRMHISNLIKSKEEAGWKFVFLSSDLSAVQEARDFAICQNRSAQFEKINTSASFSLIGKKVAAFASSRDESTLDFTEEDREAFEKKK